MEDTFGRNIRYLRLSVTELCDLRCRYCMAEEGVCKRGHEELCSFEELRDFTAAAAALGVTKLRVTGGEPLVRRGIVELCAMLRAVPGIEELCLTTNGTRLEQLAAPLKAAGVDRLNISLDTLRPERYREITRTGELENVLRGIEAAERAGFENIKLNCVLLGGMKRFPPWAAVLLSGALFSLFHQNPAQTVYQFLFGCVFALVVIKSGSLLPAVFMHVLNNAFIIVYQYLGAEPGETASLVLLIAGLIAAIGGITCLLLCKTPPREERERPRYGVFFLYASLGILYCAAMWALTLAAV